MDNVLQIILLAVGVLVVGIIIAVIASLVTRGQNLLNKGNALLDNGLSAYTDVDKTMYDGASVNGTQVVDLIKQYWEQDNTVAICVSTKDGTTIMYDYSGNSYALIDTTDGTALSGWPAKGWTKASTSGTWDVGMINEVAFTAATEGKADSVSYAACTGSYTKLGTKSTIGSTSNGYNAGAATEKGFINTSSGVFQGSCQSDINGNIRCITFVQQ